MLHSHFTMEISRVRETSSDSEYSYSLSFLPSSTIWLTASKKKKLKKKTKEKAGVQLKFGYSFLSVDWERCRGKNSVVIITYPLHIWSTEPSAFPQCNLWLLVKARIIAAMFLRDLNVQLFYSNSHHPEIVFPLKPGNLHLISQLYLDVMSLSELPISSLICNFSWLDRCMQVYFHFLQHLYVNYVSVISAKSVTYFKSPFHTHFYRNLYLKLETMFYTCFGFIFCVLLVVLLFHSVFYF